MKDDSTKLLELTVKLLKETKASQSAITWGIKDLAKQVKAALSGTVTGDSTDTEKTLKLTGETYELLYRLLNAAENNVFSQSYMADYAKEIAIKEEILSTL